MLIKTVSIYFFLLLSFSSSVFAQVIKQLEPELGAFIEKSAEGERAFIKTQEQCNLLWEKQAAEETLTEIEAEILANCSEEYESYWDVIGAGCSWYCGGGQDTNSATSELASATDRYAAANIHDLSYETAWVEGVPGDGIGECISFHFPPQNPRITEIIIVNGYVMSDKTWRENSRVKQLKMYLNGEAIALLNLKDSKHEQHFKFEPLGYSDRTDMNALRQMPWWRIDFEIMSVYKGEKFDDTAITEIFFDGIDVH